MISAMFVTFSLFALLFASLTFAAVRNEIRTFRVNQRDNRDNSDY